MSDTFERNPLYEEKFDNVEKDIKVLYKKVDGLESMKEVLIRLEMMYGQTSEAISEIKKSNERLTDIVQEQSVTLTKVGNNLDLMKNEIDETKTDLKNLTNKIDEKPTDSFKEFLQKLGYRIFEMGISGGIIVFVAYLVYKNFLK